MADRASESSARERPRRPRWVRFAKAASKDISLDIYLTATKRGLDVSFLHPSSTRSSSGTSGSSTSGSSTNKTTGDGCKTDVFCCLKGFLEQLELSEKDTGVVAMMTYGLMKGRDLEVLPMTWRALLMAALRMAVLYGLKPESKSTRAAERLQTLVELWRPTWQQDYDSFISRGHIGTLLSSALAAATELQKAPSYKESEADWDREEHVPAQGDAAEAVPLKEENSDNEMVSI